MIIHPLDTRVYVQFSDGSERLVERDDLPGLLPAGCEWRDCTRIRHDRQALRAVEVQRRPKLGLGPKLGLDADDQVINVNGEMTTWGEARAALPKHHVLIDVTSMCDRCPSFLVAVERLKVPWVEDDR